MTSRPKTKSFRDAKRAKVQLPQLVIIICEGENTEIDYFNRWKEEIGKKARVIVEQASGTAPQSIVRTAIAKKVEESADSPVIWCVGDKDDWGVQVLHDQMQKARSKGIGYVLSVPCLEIWFVLHYEIYARPEHHHTIQSIAKSKMPAAIPNQGEKSLNRSQVDSLHTRHLTAIANAKNLDRRNVTARTPFPANPSTNMWELIEYLISLC